MIDLFKGELLRFRLWALVAAVINLAVLGFLTRMVDLAQQPLLVYQVFGMVYAVAGMLARACTRWALPQAEPVAQPAAPPAAPPAHRWRADRRWRAAVAARGGVADRRWSRPTRKR